MYFIGLMSGTSLDGIDAALVHFGASGDIALNGFCHTPYSPALTTTLQQTNAHTPLAEALSVDAHLADSYAKAVAALLQQTNTTPEAINAIGLHGQTVWHAPNQHPPISCQLGDPSRLAERTGITVVADFRQRDLAAGGQGAPLAPLFHSALFGAAHSRGVVNLGGIANLSVLAAGGKVVRGFDCGPANTLLDQWAMRHQQQPFDANGAWAASGKVDHALLAQLQTDGFFHQPAPKSTGPEHFNLAWLNAQLTGKESAVDVQATLAALTAWGVSKAVQENGEGLTELIIGGGGARNTDLITRIAQQLPNVNVINSDACGLPAEAIESVGFAWLARATLQRQAFDLAAITGAKRPVILGGIYPA